MSSLLGRLLLVVSIALLPALAFQTYSEITARDIRRQLMEDEALRLVQLLSADQQQMIERANQLLTGIGSAPVVQDKQSDLCQRLLTNLRDASPRYQTLAVIGLDGHPFCASAPFDHAADLSGNATIQHALRTGTFVPGVYAPDWLTGQPAIDMAKPFKDPSGALAGVAVLSIDLRWLGEHLARFPLPDGATATIVDSNGTILARTPDGDDWVGRPILDRNRFLLHGSRVGTVVIAGADERPRILGYAPLGAGSDGLFASVGLDPDVAFAAVAQANRTGLVLIAVASVLTLALTVLLGTRLIRRPVNRLLGAAEQWRTGDLAARTGLPEGGDEFGRLSVALNAMAAALGAREQALRNALESTTDIVFVLDRNWRYTFLNTRANDLFAHRHDLLGVALWDAFPDYKSNVFGAAYREAMETGVPTRVEGYFAPLDAWWQAHAYPSKDGLTVFARNMTDEHRLASQLRESETRLQLAREASGLGVWDWDFIAGTRIWSDEQWRLYGLEPRAGAPTMKTWESLIHPEDLGRIMAEWAESMSGHSGLIHNEFRIVFPDGGIRWLVTKARIVRDDEDKIARIVGATLDVTTSRQTEADLRDLSARLETRVEEEVAAREAAQVRAVHAERMQALGRLAGGIAHDFNNVLQAVSGAMALIERRPDDPAGIRRIARLAGEATERGASITRRLLAFGRRGDLRAEAIDAALLLHDLSEILVHTLGAAIHVRVCHDEGLRPFLADKSQLETSIINLATNARDAMPDGGTLTLAAGVETVTKAGHPYGLDPGRYVRLTIEDTGVGMDAAILARASEPFFTTKNVGSGTGLGLAMAKGFAEQSGGGMKIASTRGAGTTITLWFPETDPALVAAPAEPAASDDRREDVQTRIRVLLVDDEEPVREVLGLQLEDAGYTVLSAASGNEAISMLTAGLAVDILVTDLSMPGMDGLAVIRTVQERYPGLPAVLLTGYAGDAAALALGSAVKGPFALLRKPVRGDQLADRLRALLAVPTETGAGTENRIRYRVDLR